MRLSKSKIKEFIKDEKKGYMDYRKVGLDFIAKDEMKHRKMLEKMLKKAKR